MKAPITILAGGSSDATAELVAGFAEPIVDAFATYRGTLISGGTRVGVSAIAGTVGERRAGAVRVIGYVPARIPPGVELDRDASRYHELRQTGGRDFSALEPVQAWRDILAAGVEAADVRLLGVGGGPIASVEYGLATALGARCGLVEGSGGAAAEWLADAPLAARVERLPPTAAAIAKFLSR